MQDPDTVATKTFLERHMVENVTCNEILDGGNQRFSIPRCDDVGF